MNTITFKPISPPLEEQCSYLDRGALMPLLLQPLRLVLLKAEEDIGMQIR